jgi:hypothetical protein
LFLSPGWLPGLVRPEVARSAYGCLKIGIDVGASTAAPGTATRIGRALTPLNSIDGAGADSVPVGAGVPFSSSRKCGKEFS